MPPFQRACDWDHMSPPPPLVLLQPARSTNGGGPETTPAPPPSQLMAVRCNRFAPVYGARGTNKGIEEEPEVTGKVDRAWAKKDWALQSQKFKRHVSWDDRGRSLRVRGALSQPQVYHQCFSTPDYLPAFPYPMMDYWTYLPRLSPVELTCFCPWLRDRQTL